MVKFLIESAMVILFLSIINNILGEQSLLFNILYGVLFLWIVNILSPVDYD